MFLTKLALGYLIVLDHLCVVKPVFFLSREHKMGLTPLLAAAKEGHEVIFETLLRHNASLKARTNLGEDVRSLALRHGNTTVVNIIDLQSYHHQPNYLLRSEPGLLPDDEVSGSGMENKVHGWLQDKIAIQTTGIRDGPEAFAKLVSSHQNGGQPMNIPTPLGKQNRTAHLVESPHHLSVTPNTPEGTVGSFEEHFFVNCGRTFESASLHKRLQKVNSGDTVEETNRSLQNHANGIPPVKPTVASFLQELNLTKYLSIFEEQDVDFSTLLTLTDNDLKEVGITLFGPRRKISTAISRWKEEHSQVSTDCKAVEKLKFQAQQAEVQLERVTSEVQQFQAQLIQEKDLRLVVESCLMEEKAKRQDLYNRVCKLQEHWKHVEGEVEKLKALTQDTEKLMNLSEDQAKDLHDKLQNSVTNLGSFVHQGSIGTNCILFGHQNEQSGNSSESSGNSSS